MTTMQGVAGVQSISDSSSPQSMYIGERAQLMTGLLHRGEQARRGRVFTGSSASTGIAIIAPATGGGHPTLWNPSDSGVIVLVRKLTLGYVSGNNAPTCIEWASTLATGASIATAAPILTGTVVAPVAGLVGKVVTNAAKWIPTVNTFTAAPTFCRTTGLSLFTGVAATAVSPFQMDVEYDGDFGVYPGTAISLCTQAATTTALFQVSVTWEEVPNN